MINGLLIKNIKNEKFPMDYQRLVVIITIIIIFKVQFVHGMEKKIKLELCVPKTDSYRI